MRRPSPEWLLVPVFALPLVAALSLVVWARHDYFSRLEPYRRDGDAIARRWIARDTGRVGWIAEQFSAELPGGWSAEDGWVPFRHPAGLGLVRVPGAKSPQTAWTLAGEVPRGLPASRLADANVRVAVETGTPVARIDGVDAGTAAFRDLIEKPDAARLRAAPLDAGTRLYLLRRSFGGEPATDLVALTALVAFERIVPPRGGRLLPGSYSADGVVVLVSSPGRTSTVYPDRSLVPPLGPYALADDETGTVRLTWTPVPSRDAPDVAWSGHLEAPLAGEWSFVLPHGGRWWETGTFMTWTLPVVAVCLAFLLVPTAILVGLRRRQRLDEARARFVNELAHDLRTPVTSLRLHAEMLAEGRVPAGAETRYLDVLGRETARLSALLANLLDLSRVERGAREYETKPLDVSEVLHEAVRDFTLLHPKRAADVVVEAPAGLVAAADRTALARCLANLLDNAGKFTSPGTAIRVAASRADAGQIRVVVADEGEGIAAAERTRIFDLYERGGAAARTGAPGTGLGLALVRDLAQGMSGRVTLLETVRGASFELLLPEADHG